LLLPIDYKALKYPAQIKNKISSGGFRIWFGGGGGGFWGGGGSEIVLGLSLSMLV